MLIVGNFKNLDIDTPEYVYKYRDWENEYHRRVLTHRELHLASPCDFEDSNDCNLEERFPQGKELYNLFIDDCKKRFPNKNRQQRRKYAQYWSVHSPMANKEELNKLLRETKELHDKRFGVLSLTLRYDNDYLWANYGANHQGCCVGFDTKKLIDSGLFGAGGQVQYDDKLPLIDFVNDDTLTKFEKNVFYKKMVPYSQEEEYRLTKSWGYEVFDKDRVAVFPVESLAQIIVGKNASEKDRDEIQSIQRNLYPNTEYIQL